jgi:hypothetical protein
MNQSNQGYNADIISKFAPMLSFNSADGRDASNFLLLSVTKVSKFMLLT